jgi:hypothetical protein
MQGVRGLHRLPSYRRSERLSPIHTTQDHVKFLRIEVVKKLGPLAVMTEDQFTDA